MKRKSVIASVLAAAMALSLAACGNTASTESAATESTSTEAASTTEAASEEAPAEETAAGDFDLDQDITVISREDGSGTRGAFIELTGVEDDNGDNTTQAAAIQSSTNGVMTAVANDETAIGYISLGSLDDSVKAVTVGGVEATSDNVSNGTYTLARPFNIVTNGEPTDAVAVDFIGYCMSPDGQALATEEGYIGGEGAEYTSTQPSGNITVGGSSSVSPLMEKLIEAYGEVNPNATIELLTTDSTTGVTGALDGTYTIGMASRELKDTETAEGATATVLAMDGIAVVVNPANSINDLSVEQIKSIYTGETLAWSELQ